jgi:hypothetical protein
MSSRYRTSSQPEKELLHELSHCTQRAYVLIDLDLQRHLSILTLGEKLSLCLLGDAKSVQHTLDAGTGTSV